MTRGDELARIACGFLGTPFRLHGRDPSIGLDCVGLVTASLTAMGVPVITPVGYRLRNRKIDQWLGAATDAGLTTVHDQIAAGDVLLIRPGPMQHHLLIAASPASAIHAHAGLGRVVRQPIEVNAAHIKQWRLTD